jgi:hypothetical protein
MSKWMAMNRQSEYFGRVASLNVVTLALAGVASDDGKVRASDGEDGAAVFCVWIELSLLRDCDGGHVGHEGKEEGERRVECRRTVIYSRVSSQDGDARHAQLDD